jgi:acetyltransferase EpsM
MKKLIIVGGRGNAILVASAVEDLNREEPKWNLLGLFNDSDPIGTSVNGYSVIGRPEDMLERKYADVFFVYTPLLAMPYARPNAERLECLGLPPERFATIIHPSASISKYSQIGHGVVIMGLCHIRQDVRIGNHVNVMLASAIAHDCDIADYSCMSTNSFIAGYVALEKGAYLGPHASVRERTTIGEWGLAGMGAVVIRDVPPMAVVAGNPARFIKERTFEVFDPKDSSE